MAMFRLRQHNTTMLPWNGISNLQYRVGSVYIKQKSFFSELFLVPSADAKCFEVRENAPRGYLAQTLVFLCISAKMRLLFRNMIVEMC